MNNISEQLSNIFKNIFNDEELSVSPETSAKDIDGWDSLAHIRLIFSIEKTFGLHFTAEEATNLSTVGELEDLILRKLANG